METGPNEKTNYTISTVCTNVWKGLEKIGTIKNCFFFHVDSHCNNGIYII